MKLVNDNDVASGSVDAESGQGGASYTDRGKVNHEMSKKAGVIGKGRGKCRYCPQHEKRLGEGPTVKPDGSLLVESAKSSREKTK